MLQPRLFCPEIADGPVTLSAEESHHAITVLRIKPGEKVALIDGVGGRATGVVERIRQRRLNVAVIRITRNPFDLRCKLTLAVAMPKAHRQGYLIEKCTELGVAAIWPIIADHSVTRPRAGAVERWARRAVEAAKQSNRAWIPTIAAPRSFRESIGRIKEFDAACFADAAAPAGGITSFLEASCDVGVMIGWVGPEGGWSDAERDSAIEAGAVAVKLSPTVLRTETAACALCAAVAARDPARKPDGGAA